MEIASPSVLIWTVLVFSGYVLSVCLHEFGHAVVAYWGGDTSVKDKGYLTLNPLKYTDPAYSLWMPLIFLLLGGIPLPGAAVYINVGRLRGPAWRSAVSAAGPLMTGVVAVAIALYLHLIQPDYAATNASLFGLLRGIDTTVVTRQDWLYQGLTLLLTLEVAGVFLNLLPLPGLDGYGIIEPWLPITIQKTARKYSRYSILALFAAFWMIPSFNQGFWGLINGVVTLLGVPAEAATVGFILFRQGATTVFVVLIVGLVIFTQWQKRHGAPNQPSTAELTSHLATVDQHLEQQPQDAEALMTKACLLVELNQYESGLAALNQSVDIDPDDAAAWHLKGVIEQELKHLDAAIAAYQQAVSLNPHHGASWLNLGALGCEQKQYAAALPHLEKALKYLSDDASKAEAISLQSVAYFDLERYHDCLTVLDLRLDLDPQDAAAAYNKACCYAQLGDIATGKTWLAKATAQNSDLQRQSQTDEDLAPLRDSPKY